MATLYVDFDNGNDNNGGTSFATLASGANGRITGSTFSSAGATFPNDGSLINQYLSIFNGSSYVVYEITAWVSSTSLTIAAIPGGSALANQAVDRAYIIGGRWKSLSSGATAVRVQPGDQIRLIGSPAPTSLGQNGVWTSSTLPAPKNITGATNATPISVTCTAHGYSTGDTIVITGAAGNTNANDTWEITVTGANTFTLDGSSGNGTWTSGGTARLRNNARVLLTTPVTQNIACTGPGRTAWTAAPGGNVTTSLTSITKEGALGDQIAIATAFTTGLAAYWTLPTPLNLSAYAQISFWLRSSLALSAGQISLALCSDTAGASVVNSFPIPVQGGTAGFAPFVIDFGTNLGSNIQSIALYVNVDIGALTVNLSNIIACKPSSAADSLNLTSLIGKNTSGETYWGIQSINGRRVMLDSSPSASPTTPPRGYYGTSETVTTWKRETIKIGPGSNNATFQTVQESGNDGNPIVISGGWDRTSMSAKNLETWLDGANGSGYGLGTGSRSFVNVNNIAVVRAQGGIVTNTTTLGCNYDIIALNNCAGAGATESGVGATWNVGFCAANAGDAIQVLNDSNNSITARSVSCSGGGLRLQGGLGSLATVNVSNSASSGILNSGSPQLVRNSVFTDNSVGVTATGTMYCVNCLFNETTEFSFTSLSSTMVFSQDHDQTPGNHKIFMSGALISSATDRTRTGGGFSWKIQPTSTNRSSAWPVVLSLAKVAVAANSLVTIKAWMVRDNSGLTMRLVCQGGQIAGVNNDVVSTVVAVDAWEEETITFTPTASGVVEIIAEAWGGTTFSGWVDDMTISQA